MPFSYFNRRGECYAKAPSPTDIPQVPKMLPPTISLLRRSATPTAIRNKNSIRQVDAALGPNLVPGFTFQISESGESDSN